jgi:hypothetical protein
LSRYVDGTVDEHWPLIETLLREVTWLLPCFRARKRS